MDTRRRSGEPPTESEERPRRRLDAAVGLAVLGGPSAWVLHAVVSRGLDDLCADGPREAWLLELSVYGGFGLLTVGAVAICIISTALGYRAWSRAAATLAGGSPSSTGPF